MVCECFFNFLLGLLPTSAVKISIYLVLYFGYKTYHKWMQGRYFTEHIRADGKVVIITGANCGIGKETAKSLAKRGAKVIMACRDKKRAEAARDEIISETNNDNIVFRKLDLTSFASVREFCAEILREEPKIDILINNAGIMGVDRTITEDGLEMHMQANHFGHFLLTNLLLDRIKETPNSRIVCVSSMGHTYAPFVKEDIENNYANKYSFFEVYSDTKLANVLFANELARKLEGTSVTVNSLHPGAIYTEIGRNIKLWGLEKVGQAMFAVVGRLFFRTAESGAQTSIYAALEPSLAKVKGEYFDDCAMGKMNPKARDEELAKWLWNYSEKVTKLKSETK